MTARERLIAELSDYIRVVADQPHLLLYAPHRTIDIVPAIRTAIAALREPAPDLRGWARHKHDCQNWRCKACGEPGMLGSHYRHDHPKLHTFVPDCTCGLAAALTAHEIKEKP